MEFDVNILNQTMRQQMLSLLSITVFICQEKEGDEIVTNLSGMKQHNLNSCSCLLWVGGGGGLLIILTQGLILTKLAIISHQWLYQREEGVLTAAV